MPTAQAPLGTGFTPAQLLDAFFRFRKVSRTDATLVLTGVDNMRLPQRSDIEFLGFVPVVGPT